MSAACAIPSCSAVPACAQPRRRTNVAPVRRAALALAVLGCLVVAFPAAAPAQVAPGPPKDSLAADGPITEMLHYQGRVYLRGGFSRLGRFTGSGLGLHPDTGVLDNSFV